ncbi:ImmA/IrrE family metallo-endopeptidase [Brevibacillus brevis]|uniref:ImmA/IrrE family metallo-endopeptidase n=1 Tax=Brevibacillus brevis TaxID=1393 RepID=UPI0007D8BD5C|nr:ImmA/IrrE family metallo-endopeptidase [Brevibacillus brevis]WGV57973.1 ImmA/IrrE family metallo-endopeptidase [Brevibacillus brevis]
MASEFGRFKSKTIDNRLPTLMQREPFYHELYHILRHAGQQIMMPASFRELQESEARNFTMYAAMPLHMLKNYVYTQPEIVVELSEQFRVTLELC